MNLDKQSVMFLLQTVSPVHIGCDEIYEPTGFVIDEDHGCLVVFDTLDFIDSLSPEDRRQFSDICRRGSIESIIEIYRFLRNRPADGRRVELSNGFISHYQTVLKLSRQRISAELNRFEIQRTAYCPADQRPYIPGSAVKGAIRTAVLNTLSQKRRLPVFRGRKAHRDLEEKLLGLTGIPAKDKMSKDPFRLVKVSDFMPVGDISARVVYAVNRKKGPSAGDARGPYQILEVILPKSFFMGRITVEVPQGEGAVSLTLSMEQILNSCSRFYGDEKDRERRELGSMGLSADEFAVGEQHPIRIGRHSGAECVTILDHREIRVMQQRGTRSLDHATTVWLASKTNKPREADALTPFGWTVLKSLNESGIRDFKMSEEDYQRRIAEGREGRRRALLKRLAEEQTRREIEQKEREEVARKEAAEAERRARIDAMTPEERMIEEVKDPGVIENRVVEIYNQFDNFSTENQAKLAEVLKIYWMSAGKWKKKKCTLKQWKKVQKVKNILGE